MAMCYVSKSCLDQIAEECYPPCKNNFTIISFGVFKKVEHLVSLQTCNHSIWQVAANFPNIVYKHKSDIACAIHEKSRP